MSAAQANSASEGWIVYPIGSKPKWPLAFLMGIQQYLTMFGSTVLIPFIITGEGGINMPPQERALLISTIFFASGLCTLIQQSPLGNRLPVVQGGTFSFLAPTFAIIGMVAVQGAPEGVELWQFQIQQLSGAILLASLVEIFLGYTGLIGLVRRFISPIVIAPTIAMIGLALFGLGISGMAKNWFISGLTLVALIVYSQVFARSSKVFLLFPVLLAILTGWIAALIGTVTGLLPPNDPAYLSTSLIDAAPWVSLMPIMPFKWGFPDFTSTTLLAGAIGMLAGYMASMIESIGDYYACARISEAPVPTGRMISRGLGAEGLGCFIAGILQTGNGTTTYSENIGSIGLTRVASRRVVICGAVAMLFIPLIGKFGALLASLPSPVVSAMFVGLFGMIASVGLSNLQLVNMNNSRNLFIIGISMFVGLSAPAHFAQAKVDFAAYGVFAKTVGDILQSILTSGMSVTAVVALLLDNTLPGATRGERGLEAWDNEASDEAWEKAEAEWSRVAEGAAR